MFDPFGFLKDPTAVAPETVKEALDDKLDVTVIDVREPDEYAAGHIQGSILIPLAQVPGLVGEIDKTKKIYMYCRSGGRSGRAVGFLKQQGFTDVHNMTGGILAWTQKGYSLV